MFNQGRVVDGMWVCDQCAGKQNQITKLMILILTVRDGFEQRARGGTRAIYEHNLLTKEKAVQSKRFFIQIALPLVALPLWSASPVFAQEKKHAATPGKITLRATRRRLRHCERR